MYWDTNDSLNHKGLSVHIILPAFSQSRFPCTLIFIKNGVFRISCPGEERMKIRLYRGCGDILFFIHVKRFHQVTEAMVKGISGATGSTSCVQKGNL